MGQPSFLEKATKIVGNAYHGTVDAVNEGIQTIRENNATAERVHQRFQPQAATQVEPETVAQKVQGAAITASEGKMVGNLHIMGIEGVSARLDAMNRAVEGEGPVVATPHTAPSI